MFLGIDQSYSGFAVTWIDSFGYHTTEVKKFDPRKLGTGVDRLQHIDRWFRGLLDSITFSEAIDHICMEGYANGAKFGREQAGELGAIIKVAINDLPFKEFPRGYPTIVPPTSLKKYVLGVGKGGKNEMLLGVYKQWDVEYKDDNAADSYGLARMAMDFHTGEPKYGYQKEVLDRLTPFTERWP